jgi:predicted porin
MMMTLRKLLLGTTALLGAGVSAWRRPTSLRGRGEAGRRARRVDLRLRAVPRARRRRRRRPARPTLSEDLDFSNDTEVHVILRGKHDASGIEYGGTVEFEADTNRTDNTDESWIFLRGGFGEFRFGDEDGVADNSAIGAQTIAAGTGGIDGSIVDAVAIGVVFPTNSNDATKIRYYTPSFGGFQVGVSYTPNQLNVDSGAATATCWRRRTSTSPTSSKARWSTTASSAASASRPRWSAASPRSRTRATTRASAATTSQPSWRRGDRAVRLQGRGHYGTEETGGLERDWFTGRRGATASGPSTPRSPNGQ